MDDKEAKNTENAESENAGQVTANGGGAEKMFSQDEVNKMIKGRSDRELQKVLSEIGFQNVDELKTLVKQKRERDEADKTELEKAREKATALEKEKTEMLLAQKVRAAQYEVAMKSAKLGIIDPDAAFKLLDQNKLEYDGGGSPTNAEQLLKELLTEKPYLLGGGGSSAMNPSKTGQANDPTIIAARKAAGLG